MKTRRLLAPSVLLSLSFLFLVLSPSALAQEPQDAPKGPPDRMTLCIEHCVDLVFKDGYYVGLNKDGKPESKWRVTAWDPDLFLALNGVALANDSKGNHQNWMVNGVPRSYTAGLLKGRAYTLLSWPYEEHDFTLTWKTSDMNGRAAVAFSDDRIELPEK